jgi:molecular chaperone HtpG
MIQSKETLGFQAEVKQLLQLMIHSLYSNSEIFLRELVSNASDACDKLRFEAIDRPDLYEGAGDLLIQVEFDANNRTITVSDNGIGLSRQEAIDHLGTIARSGTRDFFSKLTGDQSRDANLIGQFGVGFYSCFIIGDKVTVESRRAGLGADEGVRWESDGTGEFTVETIHRPQRGTRITVHVRPKPEGDPDAQDPGELLSGWRLRSIIRRYSDHISLPIQMRSGDAAEGEWESVNQASALWSRPKTELTDEQYRDFYKHLSNDAQVPLAWTHNRVEGRTEYTQLLYVPARAPFDLWDRQQRRGVRLYVRRVFIMDDAEQLMPSYLRFIKGVVDAADLPLNVSREILQESRDVRAIREGCTKRVLSLLEDLASNRPDDYSAFWSQFGQVLKEGLGEDFANHERLAKLLRFASTQSAPGAQSVALADYVARMKPGQDKIYYVTAETESAARNSPHLEVFRRKDLEVLVLTDRVDEWMLSYLQEFDGRQLVSVARGDLDLGTLQDAEEKQKAQDTAQAFADLVAAVKTNLGQRVKDVRVTDRLTDSPSCVVSDEGDMSGTLARLLKQAGQKAPERMPILELNPTHRLVTHMKTLHAQGDSIERWAQLLLDQALLAEGAPLDDPAGYVRRLNDMLVGLTSA